MQLSSQACEQAKETVREKMKMEWSKWKRKDFTLPNDQRKTKAIPLILCRAATEARIKKFLQDNNCWSEQGLTLEGFDCLVGDDEHIANEEILELHRQDILEIQNIILQSPERRLSWQAVESYIGSNGEQNDGWRVKGLSYATCRRFLAGDNIREQENFNPFSFLCNLLDINCEDSLSQICAPALIRKNILEDLQRQLHNIDVDLNEQIVNLLKRYVLSIDGTEQNFIESNIFDQLVETILNVEDGILLKFINSLAQDTNLGSSIRHIFDFTLQELRQQLKIPEPLFNQYTETVIQPANIRPSFSESYLILKTRISDNRLGNNQYKIEDAYLLDDHSNSSQPSNYNSLKKIIQECENQEYYSPEKLKMILTQLIRQSCTLRYQQQNTLVIEFFCDIELLSSNFDCWQCESPLGLCQLREMYLVRVRCLSRLDPMYQGSQLQRKWKEAWENLQENFAINSEKVNWMNLCQPDPKTLNSLFKKLLKMGIPVALWSRCHQRHQQHYQEIEAIVTSCNGEIRQLPLVIADKRMNCPSENEEPEHLGHHLSLLWEDPNIIPPFANISSGHFGQSS